MLTKWQLEERQKADDAYYAHLKTHDDRAANPEAWHAKLAKLNAACLSYRIA